MVKTFLLLLFFSTVSFSQEFKHVDERVSDYPRFRKVEELARQIKSDFSQDIHRVRAAFTWLAKNFRYDLDEFYNPRQRAYQFRYSTEAEKMQKLQALKDKLVATAFLTQKGVCEEYAQSLKKICDLLSIKSEVITGYVRNSANEINRIPNGTNHAWNAVKIDDSWIVIDATWGAGYEMNGKWNRVFNDYFFNIPKELLFKTHFPEASLWVLRFGRMTLAEFYQQPIYSTYFFESNLELIQPKTGIITTNGTEPINIRFKNLTEPIYYHFSGSRYLKKASVIERGSFQIISIPNPKRNALLNLYVNQQEVLQFQVRH